jgi:hypothetical protein
MPGTKIASAKANLLPTQTFLDAAYSRITKAKHTACCAAIMTGFVTATALAEMFGVTVRTINDLAKRGVIERGKGGYALAPNVAKYCAHLRKLAMGRGGDEAAITSRSRMR